jgi:hypothetical protein
MRIIARLLPLKQLVVIDHFHFGRPVIGPGEADPIALVYPDTELPDAISFQSLEPVARGYPKLGKSRDGVQLIELAGSDPPQVLWATSPRLPSVAAIENILSSRVLEGLNHGSMISR